MLFRPNAIGPKFVAPKMELFLLIYSTTFDAGKSYRRGMLSIVDLLVITSLYQLLFKLKIFFTFLQKQANLGGQLYRALPLN
jgi:hypothetical protein